MAVTYGGNGLTVVAASSSTWAITNQPTGVVAGSILLAFFFPTNNTRTVASFPGWSAIPGTTDSRSFWRVATGIPADDFPAATMSAAALGVIVVIRLASSLGGAVPIAGQSQVASPVPYSQQSQAVSAPAAGFFMGVAYSYASPGFSSPTGATILMRGSAANPLYQLYRSNSEASSATFGWVVADGNYQSWTTAVIVYEGAATNPFFFGGEL